MSNVFSLTRAVQAASILVAAMAALPAAHAASPAQGSSVQSAPQALTRAEVKPDLALWRRAKVDEYGVSETWPTMQAERAKRMALYKGWRDGPEFQEELRRQQGAR